jgi:hypothetical protein
MRKNFNKHDFGGEPLVVRKYHTVLFDRETLEKEDDYFNEHPEYHEVVNSDYIISEGISPCGKYIVVTYTEFQPDFKRKLRFVQEVAEKHGLKFMFGYHHCDHDETYLYRIYTDGNDEETTAFFSELFESDKFECGPIVYDLEESLKYQKRREDCGDGDMVWLNLYRFTPKGDKTENPH